MAPTERALEPAVEGLVGHSHGAGGGEEDEEDDRHDHAQDREHRGNDPHNFSAIGEAPAFGVHLTGIHLFQIPISHQPGGDAAGKADHKTQDTQDQDERASMSFHGVEETWRSPRSRPVLER